jgi:regulator of sirC expression with transglutaminase-like and TPR domain
MTRKNTKGALPRSLPPPAFLLYPVLVPFSLDIQARTHQVAGEMRRALDAPGGGLAPAALAIAGVEYPNLDTAVPLATLDDLGARASARLDSVRGSLPDRVRALNEFFYDDCGFTGNRQRYDDPRNSFLNEVLERRTGLPITLAIVYIEVARRAGVRVQGVSFPGHFLMRIPVEAAGDRPAGDDLILDPFHGGALLSEFDCRQILREHVGDEAAFSPALLAPATRLAVIARMLVNLKRLYVRMRSFPQARFVSSLLLAVDPSAIAELRDRGLLAYHLQDFAAALRDLEEYLRLAPKGAELGDLTTNPDESEGAEPAHLPPDDATQIWEHVKTLRRRVASFN